MPTPTRPPPTPSRVAVLEQLGSRSEELVEHTVGTIWAEIPSYPAVADGGLLADVRQHVADHHQALLRSLADGTTPTREDLAFTRRPTANRVGRIPIADYLQAFRTYQGIIWNALLEEARDPDSREAVLSLVSSVLDYVNVATTYAAELYIETEQFQLAGGERVRRDLLEDLVASRPVADGARQEAARNAGLGPDIPCLVIVAIPFDAPENEHVLRSAARALARAFGGRQEPLTVLRGDEIVVVAPSGAARATHDDVVARLTETCTRLAGDGVQLAIGVSTEHPGLGGVAVAHREARGAAECVGRPGGVLALPTLSAFEYLSSFRDRTAERLIAPEVQHFVLADIDSGGVLTSTLLAYVSSDLNVKALSERIHIHPNTAHYRLNKIAEQTGRDLRKLSDVLDLVIAIRHAQPLGERLPGSWT